MKDRTRILIVEDEPIVAEDIKDRLEQLGYQVAGMARSGEKAIELAEKEPPDLFLMDIRLEGKMDGIQAADNIRKFLHLPVIFLTAYSEDDKITSAKLTEPFGYLLKPFEDRELKTTIEMALYKHKIENELRLNKEFAENLIKSLADGLLVINKDAARSIVNEALCNMTGFSKEELLSDRLPFMIWPPEHIKEIQEDFERIMTGNSNERDFIFMRKNGERFPVIVSPSYMKNEQGEIVTNILIIKDITVRKQAEEELLKSKFLLNETQRISRVGGWEYDVINGKTTWTEETYRIYGVTPADYDPNNLKQDMGFFANNDRVIIEGAFKKAVEEGEAYDLELKFRNARGKDMWVRTIAKPVYKDGRVSRIYGNIMDITDRMVAQEQNQMLRHSIDIFYDGIYWMDSNNKFIYINDAGCIAFGYSREELLTMTVYDVNPKATEQNMKLVWDMLRTKGFFSRESIHRRKDGTEFPVELRSTYVKFAGREYIGGYARDLTEQKRAEKEQIALIAREQAALAEAAAQRELNRLKSMFIAATSHELRTPLNSIIGFTGLTLDGFFGELNPDQKKHLILVQLSGKHLLSLINDILDLSMVECGKIRAVVSDFNLKQIVEEAASTLKVILNVTKIELKVDVSDITMRSDRTRLLQCLINLISNAIKFTEKGSIVITAKVIDRNIEISVIDTGIGIRNEDIPKLFAPFMRLETPLTAKTSGTGLGLYLVKIITEDVLGGDVEVESEFGAGSKFTLRIPVKLEGKV